MTQKRCKVCLLLFRNIELAEWEKANILSWRTLGGSTGKHQIMQVTLSSTCRISLLVKSSLPDLSVGPFSVLNSVLKNAPRKTVRGQEETVCSNFPNSSTKK